MLFHITQTHTPQTCPKDDGGSRILYDENAEGVNLVAIYGAFPDHVVYYVVEADGIKSVDKFLMPGFKRCTSRITPVSEVPLIK